jgi:8-oxo-dGTP diphosphatase
MRDIKDIKTEYVLGFCFSNDKQSVVLIGKEKPTWQKGLLNGVGGKVEVDDKVPNRAMIREFAEETGVKTKANDWHNFANMVGDDWKVWCYSLVSQEAYEAVTTLTSEKIYKMAIKDLDPKKCVSNLAWLIPMGLDENYGKYMFGHICY